MPVWTISINSIDRKYKKFEINKKVRMDSPPEFTATIEYADDVDFLDIITFSRDGTVEWKGFVEDIEIDWDENGRYLNLAGRDMTLLLWRKYVENFNNPIPKTGGFFGYVSASELTQFLLRTPRSDLPVNADTNPNPTDSTVDNSVITQYQYNKEGWGIDPSRFNGLDAKNTGYGDINTAILRKRNLYWSNSGSQFKTAIKVVDNVIITDCTWEEFGTPPYLNTDDADVNYIKSHVNVTDVAEFSFEDFTTENATTINSCVLIVKWRPDGTMWYWIESNCEIQIWVNSSNSWITVGSILGRSPPWDDPWRKAEFDISTIIKTVDDANAIKVKFIDHSNDLSTQITYSALSLTFTSGGNQTTDDWVSVAFDVDDADIMGIYVECREHPDNFPRNYKITCNGLAEDFSDYIKVPNTSHILLSSDSKTITFDSYQNETSYFYKDIGASPPQDFDESFSFKVDTSIPHTYAFIPWCLSNNIEGYETILGTSTFTSVEVKSELDELYIRVGLRDPTHGLVYSSYYLIDKSTVYWVRVTRSGTALLYSIYNDSAMETGDLVFDCLFTIDTTTFRYRYQAITYNGAEWAEVFENNMDYFFSEGEQVDEGGFETGWGSWNHYIATRTTAQSHSGSYSADLTASHANQPYISQSFDNIPKTNVTSFTLWYKAILSLIFLGTNQLFIKLYFSDSTTQLITTPTPTNIWTEIDLLPYWEDGKLLNKIEIDGTDDVHLGGSYYADYYIDDVSLIVDTSSSSIWSSHGATSGGAATLSTDPLNKAPITPNVASQKIRGTSDGTGYYFERNITATNKIKVDAYIRVPAPHSDSISNDVFADPAYYDSRGNPYSDFKSDYSSGTEGWGEVGTNPWIDYNHGSSDMDTNHITYFPALSSHYYTFYEYWTFEPLNFATGKTLGSFAPDTNSHLKIKARLQDGSGGSPSCTLSINIWVQHANEWQELTQVAFSSTVWGDIIDEDVSAYLTCKDDWDNLKVRIDVASANADMVSNGYSVQIGYIVFHAQGTGYSGSINLMKVYNNDKAIGPNPSNNYLAKVSCQLDPASLTDQDKWRFVVDGLGGTGTPYSNSTTIKSVTANDWYWLELEACVGSGTDGYFKLTDITIPVSPVLLCQITGIDNSNYGPIDRFEYEGEFGFNNGSIAGERDIYLDEVTIQVEGGTYSTGYVYAGYGADILLVNVVDNIYPDIIHSWQPRSMKKITISITEADAIHGWEISQIYVYKTDPIKYRVVLDGLTQPVEELFTFNAGGYTPCDGTDIGKQVNYNGDNQGELISYDNDMREWRVATYTTFGAGDSLTITNGIGAGTLSVNSSSSYAGGPYINTISIDHEYSAAIGPINIPKNRLFDILWDLCVTITDDFYPYEWWVAYDTNNTFHISNRRGSDLSGTISFVTGVNMQGVKYAKSSRDTYQRCQVVGSGEGNTQVNTSSFWEVDEDAMDEIHGFIEDIITQKQVSTPKIANRYAKVKLKLDASPKRKNAITCTVDRDTYGSLDYDVGDDVWITDLFTSLDDSKRIYNIKKTVEGGVGEVVTLTVQAPYIDIGNVWTDIWDELKQLAIVGTIKEDWAGDGTDTSLVSADKVSTLFTVTAKNEETDVATTPSTSPNWWTSASGGANWNSGNNNLSIYGGDTGLGSIEVEARWAAIYTSDGLTVVKDGETVPDNAIKVPINITMDQEPKFTGEFKIMQPYTDGSHYSLWAEGDYAEFGMFNCEVGIRTGFKFRIVCDPSDIFSLYAIFLDGPQTYENDITQLVTNRKAKLLCTLSPNVKYKVEIIADYKDAISTVTFSVYPLEDISGNPVDNPASMQISAVFLKIDKSLSVRPIYLYVRGTGNSGSFLRCIMNFYDLKCERDII